VFEWSYWGYGSAFALIAWLPFGLWRFSRVRPALASAQVTIWAMMWLPEGAAFDLPALPPFSKYTIGAVCMLLGLMWKAPERLRAARIGRGYDLLVGLLVVAQVGTVLTNSDGLHYGTYKTIDLPGFTPYDGISAAVRVLLTIGLPFVLGRALLRSERDLADLLETLAVAGVAYSLPILFEIRMSPVLHDMVYGYAPRSDWSQNLRAGGYRPTAFMGHGLVVGFFMFLCTLSAVTLQKAGRKRLLGVPIGWVVAWLWLNLVLCKAAAPIIYAAVGCTIVLYASPRWQARVLTGLTVLVLSYPITRILDLFPVEGILSLAGALGPDRVQSLQFRFDNEDILLLKGAERLWFGWGGYGRERVFDAETAKDLVIQDGQWIVVFGQSGLIGFLGYFALLLLPVWQLARGLKRVAARSERTLLAGFGFGVVVCSVNMLPNMQLPYLQFMFAAGLAVVCGVLSRPGSRAAPARSVRPSRRPSQRPSRSAPLRPIWYSAPPPEAYAADLAPRPAQHVHITPVSPEAAAAVSGVDAAEAGHAAASMPERPGAPPTADLPLSQLSAATPANDATPSGPVRTAEALASDAAQERSGPVQTVVIRAVTERPTMRPPAPPPDADLSAPDLVAAVPAALASTSALGTSAPPSSQRASSISTTAPSRPAANSGKAHELASRRSSAPKAAASARPQGTAHPSARPSAPAAAGAASRPQGSAHPSARPSAAVAAGASARPQGSTNPSARPSAAVAAGASARPQGSTNPSARPSVPAPAGASVRSQGSAGPSARPSAPAAAGASSRPQVSAHPSARASVPAPAGASVRSQGSAHPSARPSAPAPAGSHASNLKPSAQPAAKIKEQSATPSDTAHRAVPSRPAAGSPTSGSAPPAAPSAASVSARPASETAARGSARPDVSSAASALRPDGSASTRLAPAASGSRQLSAAAEPGPPSASLSAERASSPVRTPSTTPSVTRASTPVLREQAAPLTSPSRSAPAPAVDTSSAAAAIAARLKKHPLSGPARARISGQPSAAASVPPTAAVSAAEQAATTPSASAKLAAAASTGQSLERTSGTSSASAKPMAAVSTGQTTERAVGVRGASGPPADHASGSGTPVAAVRGIPANDVETAAPHADDELASHSVPPPPPRAANG